jgi:hypothetical protein
VRLAYGFQLWVNRKARKGFRKVHKVLNWKNRFLIVNSFISVPITYNLKYNYISTI